MRGRPGFGGPFGVSTKFVSPSLRRWRPFLIGRNASSSRPVTPVLMIENTDQIGRKGTVRPPRQAGIAPCLMEICTLAKRLHLIYSTDQSVL